MEKVVISGSNGLIGRALFERLKNDYNVVGFDINSGDGVLHGDVLNRRVRDFIDRGDMVIHTAAIPGVDNVLRNPVKCWESIVGGTKNMVEACVDKKAGKFINFSTSEVLGNTALGATLQNGNKELTVGGARCLYSRAKFDMEGFLVQRLKSWNIPSVTIRPFNVFGPGQKTGGAIFRLINQCLKNESLEIRNHGTQIRSWCYIDDLVDGTIVCMNSDQCANKAIAVGNPANTLTTDLLAKMIKRLSESKSNINYVDWNEEDIELRIPDISFAHKIGFIPRVDLEDGIIRTIEYYRELNNED